MTLLSTSWIIAYICAFILYGAGKRDPTIAGGGSDLSILWVGLSIAVSAVIIEVVGGGVMLVLIAQAALFIGIGIFRARRDR